MADLLPDLKLRSLAEVSRGLDLAPLEVIRLSGLLGLEPAAAWALDPRLVEKLVEVGGVEPPWPHEPQEDPVGYIRAVLRQLRDRNLEGDQMTRIDNTWRGLPPSIRGFLAEGFDVLAELGWVHLASRPEGRRVALAAGSPESLEAFLEGGDPPAPLVEALAAVQEESAP